MNLTATQEELEAGRGYEALFVPAVFQPWNHSSPSMTVAW
jgi:hypothetical protein